MGALGGCCGLGCGCCIFGGALWPTAGDFFCTRGGGGLLPGVGDTGLPGAASGSVMGLRGTGPPFGVVGALLCKGGRGDALEGGRGGAFLSGVPPTPTLPLALCDMLGDFLCPMIFFAPSTEISDGVLLWAGGGNLLFSIGEF